MQIDLRLPVPADEDWEWHWRHELPDAAWKRWDAPYFHAGERPLSRAEFAALRATAPHQRRIITAAGAPVGTVTRWEEEPAGGGWWELGIALYDPAWWGRGVGSEALRRWTDDTFAGTDAHVITLTTWSGNERMVRAAARIGFRECGRVSEARSWEGRRYDSVRLARLRAATPPHPLP